MNYPGGKGGAGVYQRLINLMPAHDVYIETHVGGGAIYERKRPAPASIIIDVDGDVAGAWRSRVGAATTVVHGDAAAFLRSYPFTGRELIYADPPYVRSTRRGGAIYRHEYSDEQHRELLSLLLTVRGAVMISGYRTAMYDDALRRWRRIDFQAMTRGGLATESVWMNYDPPKKLHDFSHLGDNFRQRERIKRKQARWRARFAQLPASERMAMLEALLKASPEVAGEALDLVLSARMAMTDLPSPGMAMTAVIAESGAGARAHILEASPETARRARAPLLSRHRAAAKIESPAPGPGLSSNVKK